jgi:hypothetical protein
VINYSVIIGSNAKPKTDDGYNEVIIGYNAIGNGSNTVQLGNTSVTNVNTSGTITANAVTYPNAHGTNGQVLTTTGSGTLTWTSPSGGGATISDATDETTATFGQTSFTLLNTPASTSKVKMYINGIRISNAAYDFTTTPGSVIYNSINNGGYKLLENDRIQFDYFH